jgi:predicted amidohydrolase YtcJ
MKFFLSAAVTAAVIIFGLTGCATEDAPDMILHNGQIETMSESGGTVQAVAIGGGRILATGSSDDILAMAGRNTRTIDLEGHGHFTGIGTAQMQLDLLGVESWQEIVAMVEEAVAEAEEGELILGRGWHQNDWTVSPDRMVGDLPHHESLSAVSPDNPVLLRHASGHMRFANARAMEMAGVTADTEDPRGGEIVRDENGEPAGPFRQRAMDLLLELEESWDPDMGEIMALASLEVVRHGITTFGDAGTPVRDIRRMMDVRRDSEPDVRLHIMVRDRNETMREALPELAGAIENDPWFSVTGIKKAIDGALGTHGAWMLEPYSDMPGTTGFNTTPLEEIREAGELALAHNLQLAVHAIGDRGNRETLDLYEALFDEHEADGRELRWRIEHAQNLHPDDVPRFPELGVIASMQGVHATSDGPWVPQRLGEERARERAYVWRSLLDSGARIINGTDAPVERVDPIPSFHGSFTRIMRNGETFFPEQSMTRDEALRSYTIDAAYGIFREDDLGTLEPGKKADISVWSVNLLEAGEQETAAARAIMTITGGRVVYSDRY